MITLLGFLVTYLTIGLVVAGIMWAVSSEVRYDEPWLAFAAFWLWPFFAVGLLVWGMYHCTMPLVEKLGDGMRTWADRSRL